MNASVYKLITLVAVCLIASSAHAEQRASLVLKPPALDNDALQQMLAFHTLADATANGDRFSKMALKDVRIAKQPLFSMVDITFCNAATHRVQINVKPLRDRARKLGLERFRNRYLPIVVVAKGQRRYLGAIDLNTPGLDLIKRKRKLFGGKEERATIELAILRPWDDVAAAQRRDIRSDKLVWMMFKSARRLALYQPKLTRQQAIDKATEALVASSRRFNATAVEPTAMTVAAVHFCNSATVAAATQRSKETVPAQRLHNVWIVRFDQASGGATIAVIDHNATTINSSVVAHMDCRTYPGASMFSDVVAMTTFATEDQIKKSVQQKLSKVDELKFYQSVEGRIKNPRMGAKHIWVNFTNVWVAKGTAHGGDQSTIIVPESVAGPGTLSDVTHTRLAIAPRKITTPVKRDNKLKLVD